MSTKRQNDQRARGHPAYWAFQMHRLSGLGLALFLPLHFWALGQAIHGAAALDGFACGEPSCAIRRELQNGHRGLSLCLRR